ncbi:iron complex transport system ATP-binding protein [Hasllibacter halocynthiae]|uniref:Iron complex transport system ATP-binding protein n=1 Tax=Hasllibacter halocynthiae TaxID=595589 RepID=A0A2T0X328_9RHOB|nr:ABC transporter ATP-binding protein [Hasllibacter halocynthiae]PRY93317.1 iron complex transport system ATP-binding protein [Hasllibacter halocynthiae]
MRLEAELSVRRGGRAILDAARIAVAPGECVGLIGPNGAGKTTLMRAALGLIPAEGHSTLAALSRGTRARAAAWLPQERPIAWPLPVREVVALGRLPHGGRDAGETEAALARLNLLPLADRPATALSGGERARVLIARALAQDAPLLLADEPAAGLDPAGQIAAMHLFAELAREGRGVLVSSHDLGLAARRCDRLVLLDGGRTVAEGPPKAVLTPARLARHFALRARLEEGGRLAVEGTEGTGWG